MNSKLRCGLVPALVAAMIFATFTPVFGQNATPKNKVLSHALDVLTGRVQPRINEPTVSSGVAYTLLLSSGEINKRMSVFGLATPNLLAPALPNLTVRTAGCSNVYKKDGRSNIRVNQDCSLRRQAEEVIAINPTSPNNLIAGQNDSRIGFNRCGYDFSFDGGNTWGDQIPPFYQFLNLDGVTFDACSDPTATFDAVGNAYVGGILFEIALPDTAVLVAKSNAGIGGAFYHSPAPGPFQTYSDLPLGVVANDNDPTVSHDKEFIVADNTPSRPKANNVYATWTRFHFTGIGVGIDSPIYFSQSTDGGATWSPGIEISGANATACTVFQGEAVPNACDQDQGSHPVVGADGTVYVAFWNGNTPTNGLNQYMIVKCSAASDCSKVASWSAPVKIADDVGIQPVGPNPVTGCPNGNQCLPPNGYRIFDGTFGSLSVSNNGTLFHVFSDGRNLSANCTFFALTTAPPCDQDVFYSFSTNGGATWHGPFQITPPGTAQWMPWSAVVPKGNKLYVAYYDRSYGNCEFTGCNDITLATVHDPATNHAWVSHKRVTTSSMPNLVVANNPVEAGFLGDYMWVAVDKENAANIVWADTRGLNRTVEEDIYFARVPSDDED